MVIHVKIKCSNKSCDRMVRKSIFKALKKDSVLCDRCRKAQEIRQAGQERGFHLGV